MEIPDQLSSYMKAVGQKPKPRGQLQREWTVDAQVWSRPPQPTAPAPGAPRVLQPAAAPCVPCSRGAYLLSNVRCLE